MGMFDSFIIDIDGQEIELQTKRFDQSLQVYSLGSVISGAQPGVCVYFDEVDLDESGRMVFQKQEAHRNFIVFIVLVSSVFVDYKVVHERRKNAAIEFQIQSLKEKWSDTKQFIDFLIQALAKKQHKVQTLEHRIRQGLHIIQEVRNKQAGEPVHNFLGFSRWLKRIEEGDDPLEVIQDCLEKSEPLFSSVHDPAEKDALEAYRL